MQLTLKYRDDASPRLAGLADIVTSEGALKSGGRGLRSSIIDNLTSLGPNKRFPSVSTHFYERASNAVTQPMVSGTSATVSIVQQGIRQRYLGGPITPQKSKYLTIPAKEETYGRKAEEFPDLSVAFLGRTSSGLPILALVRGNPRISAQRDVMFWLSRGVVQDPDPTVLPTEDRMKIAFVSGLRSYTNARLGGGAVLTNEDFQ
jgi:hypothetical protein